MAGLPHIITTSHYSLQENEGSSGLLHYLHRPASLT